MSEIAYLHSRRPRATRPQHTAADNLEPSYPGGFAAYRRDDQAHRSY